MSAEPAFDLFTYPQSPGWKARDTARDAARSVKPKATLLRERILALLDPALMLTADEAADILEESVLSIRPRFSELSADGYIIDAGIRRLNSSGKRAIVWRLAPRRVP